MKTERRGEMLVIEVNCSRAARAQRRQRVRQDADPRPAREASPRSAATSVYRNVTIPKGEAD